MAELAGLFNLEIIFAKFMEVGTWCHPDLAAPYWRLYWNPDEGAVVSFRSTTEPLGPSTIVVIPPLTPFSASSPSPVHHFFCHFTITAPFNAAKPAIYAFPSTVNNRIGQMQAIVDSMTKTYPFAFDLRLKIASIITDALAQIPENGWITTEQNGVVKEAIGIIESNLKVPPRNNDLANATGMSVNAFIRLFKKKTGFSPQQYSVKHRIEKATISLHHSDLSIDDIATETGFCDRSHFSKAFKMHTGIRPAQSRRANQHGPIAR